MVEKEVCKQQSPSTDRTVNFFFVLKYSFGSSFSRFLVCSRSYKVGAFSVGPVSGYRTVSSTCLATALLLLPQTDPLTLVFTFPKPRSLEDLFH